MDTLSITEPGDYGHLFCFILFSRCKHAIPITS